MKIAVAMLQKWHREDPARLLQAALMQAERLVQMTSELETLQTQNAWLHQELEIKIKRLAQLEKALEEAQRVAHRPAAPFRGDPQKRAVAPKRPGRQRGHPGVPRVRLRSRTSVHQGKDRDDDEHLDQREAAA